MCSTDIKRCKLFLQACHLIGSHSSSTRLTLTALVGTRARDKSQQAHSNYAPFCMLVQFLMQHHIYFLSMCCVSIWWLSTPLRSRPWQGDCCCWTFLPSPRHPLLEATMYSGSTQRELLQLPLNPSIFVTGTAQLWELPVRQMVATPMYATTWIVLVVGSVLLLWWEEDNLVRSWTNAQRTLRYPKAIFFIRHQKKRS